MAKKNNTVLYVGLGVAGLAGIYLLTRPSVPGSSNPLATLIPGSMPTTYGVNSGIKGGNGSFYTTSNYQTLLAANPNLGNPNYQMTTAEANQYIANYSDLQQAFPQWIAAGNTYKGIKLTTNQQCAQAHWNNTGCAEQRIFLPLQPPSTASYIPPPTNPSTKPSGGSNWLGSALQIAGTVAALLGPVQDPQLTDAEAQVLVTGSAVIKNILPFYLQVDKNLVDSISNKVDSLVSQYQS